MFSLITPWLSKLARLIWIPNVNPQWTEDDIEIFVRFWLFDWTRKVADPQCFCCTTLRDVIFMKGYFRKYYINDLYTTHVVVYWVTAGSPYQWSLKSLSPQVCLSFLRKFFLSLKSLWGIQNNSNNNIIEQWYFAN